jgi:hypothetical protein
MTGTRKTSKEQPHKDAPMNFDRDRVARKAVEQEFLEFAASQGVRIGEAAERERAGVLERICSRPEFGPFRSGAEFVLDANLSLPFRVEAARPIRLDPALLANPVAAAVLLRQAFEIRTLQSLLPCQQEPATQWTVAGLALRCAAQYRQSLVLAEQAGLEGRLPEWLAAADAGEDADRLLSMVLEHGECLAELQGADPASAGRLRCAPVLQAAVRDFYAELLPAAAPAEWLLAQGGDNRLKVDRSSGLNMYGCSPKPRPWAVTFASSTGSSVSDLGFGAAEKVRRELLLGAFKAGFAEALDEQSSRIRRELMRVLRLDLIPGTEAVLTSSGTDGELAALYFSMAGHADPMVNILMAPAEVGSGTVPAAGGLHFDSLTPMGSCVRPGSPVAGFPPDRVSVLTVPVRDGRGEAIPVAKIDRQVQALVREAVGNGARVLLHLLDSSKTGMGAPSIPVVRAIQTEFGDRVSVVVDAAQMRVTRNALAEYIRAGFMVLSTGSKFFTGPPFSGALLVPTAIAHRVDRQPPLPKGFAAYATASDFPLRWRALGSLLGERHNVGLILRWGAALWEMKAFFAVPPAHQREVVETFLSRLVAEISGSPELELLSTPILERPEGTPEIQWDGLRTIHSFLVQIRREGTRPRVLTLFEAKLVYQWLNRDLSGVLPESAREEERRMAAIRCHIGQPVPIFQRDGETYAALRIAVGARLVSGVEFDPLLGYSRPERLETEIQGALTALRKICFIARNFEHFQARLAIEGHREPVDGWAF